MVNYSISPYFRQLWFLSKRRQKHFCSNPHAAVNWNSYKCCPATSCCRQSHMTIVVIEHENAFVKHRWGFFVFFYEKTETNMERLKCPWGCIWGIWGLVRRGVKQMNLCIFRSSGTQTHEMMGVRGLEPCKRLHDASLPVCPRARYYIIIAEWMEREAICFLLRWELHRLY